MTSDAAAIVDPIESPARASSPATGQRALHAAAVTWFAVAAAGQLMFAAYVMAGYGPSIVLGDLGGWNRILPSEHGYIPGDTVGNAGLLLHLALAPIIMVGGVLQLIPAIRRRWPAAHRWTGRGYLAAALLGTVGGLIVKLVREPVATPAAELATKINGGLIIAFAALALHHARARRIAIHRRWALRLFLAASGVWFIRVGWSCWRTIAGRLGIGVVDGLFTAMSYGQFVLPLAVLELYLRARDRGGRWSRRAVAALLGGLTIAMAVGVAGNAEKWLARL